ncbi:MAG TPA: hypothetical protein VNE42_11565 [Acidimicrobiales bacterium]|nr:hypothetical protein [Acidimicrobiales bacterium]
MTDNEEVNPLENQRRALYEAERDAITNYEAVASPGPLRFVEVMDFQLAEWLHELRSDVKSAKTAREAFDLEHPTRDT